MEGWERAESDNGVPYYVKWVFSDTFPVITDLFLLLNDYTWIKTDLIRPWLINLFSADLDLKDIDWFRPGSVTVSVKISFLEPSCACW